MSMLEVRGLTKRFGGLTAVEDLSFAMEEGQILGLIGPNGAGKTTVFNCLSGYEDPDEGTIAFFDKSVLKSQPYQICRMGMVRTFQIVKPFLTISVLENVMVAALLWEKSVKKARENAMHIIEMTGLGQMANANAESLPLPLRKRLELARALATQSKLLLLDEVMAGLTPAEVDEIIALIREINQQGIGILLIEHVMRGLMALSNQVIVINYGKQIAKGIPEEVVKDKQVIEAYLGREFTRAQG